MAAALRQSETAANAEIMMGKSDGLNKYLMLSRRFGIAYPTPNAEETSSTRSSMEAIDITQTTCTISTATSAPAPIFHCSEIFGDNHTSGIRTSSSIRV